MPNSVATQFDPKAGYLNSGQLGYAPANPQQGYYNAGPQAVLGGGYIGANQLTPQQNGPLLAGQQGQQLKNIWKQVEPTAVNLRNQNLTNIIQAMNVPMEQLYAAQGTGQAAQGRVQGMDQLRTAMAQRGMLGQGAMAEGNLGVQGNYLQNVGNANVAAQGQEQQRQQALLSQMMNIPQSDLAFYNAIRGGASSMGQLFQNQDAQFWGQAAKGLGTAARSAISAGAGAGAGGTVGGGSGTGDFGMSSAAGGDYGASGVSNTAFSGAGAEGLSYGGGGGGAGLYSALGSYF